MKNMQEVRATAAESTVKLLAGKITSKDASAVANLIGKVIATTAVQLKYAQLRDEDPDIDFLKEPGKTTKKRLAKPKAKAKAKVKKPAVKK